MENSKDISVLKRKYKATLLPEKLKSKNIGDLTQSVTALFQKCSYGEHKKEDGLSVKHIVKTLIRGLGSSNTQVQKNYFSALTVFLKSLKSLPELSVKHIQEIVGSELHISGNVSKGEKGEILMGRVLTFGALVRSEALSAAPEEDQSSTLTQVLQDVKERSYLPLAADPFLIEYFKQVDEGVFRRVVWPLLSQEVRPGPAQTLLMYHMLLVCQERFPAVISPKFLRQNLTSSTVLSVATVPALFTALKTDFKLKSISHMLYSDVFKFLSGSPEEVLQCFWEQVENQLLQDSAAYNKLIMAVEFFKILVLQFQHSSQVLILLTPKLISAFMKKYTKLGVQKPVKNSCQEAMDHLYKLCVNDPDSKTVLTVIKKLLFDPGNIFFEQLSCTKIIQHLMSHLKEKSVVKLAVVLRAVVAGESQCTEHKEGATSARPWTNKERLYTVHAFCKLLALPTMQANTQWKLQQLTFLFDTGFFSTGTIGVELAGHVRDSFYSCLNHKLPNLVDLRNILSGVVDHISGRLNNGEQLRVKISSEVIPAWNKMVTTAKLIEENKKHKKEPWVTAVFQTMFYHIGLHLFKEAAFASDVLEELHSVYERVGSTSSEEPHWTEVVVEMFLSLLSRNSQLHRHLISCVFSHFCPIMIPQNIHQILQVLDPVSETNPLLDSLDSASETTSEDEDEGGEDEKESSDDGMSEEEEEVEDNEEDNDKVNDKLRRAVLEALGDAGAMTDTESVDLETMNEEEAARVDAALSLAFKANKQVRNKKQPAHAKALTHFRIRVLDLVEIWVGSEPPLDLMMDTLLRLHSLLEFSVADKHQAPLEARVRTVIKKLTSTKKYNVSDCKSLKLGGILKMILEKGNRSFTMYMSIMNELKASTLFITRASQHFPHEGTDDDKDNAQEADTTPTVFTILKDFTNSFFLQRDCLLPAHLFLDLFKQNVPFISTLASMLPEYVFDPHVHPFRRCKAIEFLMVFWKTNRSLLSSDNSKMLKKMSKKLYKGSLKMIDNPMGRVQPKFMQNLKRTFSFISKQQWLSEVDFPQHLLALDEFTKIHAKKGKKPTIHENMEVENGEQGSVSEGEIDQNNDENKPEKETDKLTRKSDKELVSSDDSKEEEDIEENESESEFEEPFSKKAKTDDKKRSSVKIKNTQEDSNQKDQGAESSSDSAEENLEENELDSETDNTFSKKSKKFDKRRTQEKIKRTQLLKNNSKRLRLESMAVGLEQNVFSKYRLLTNNLTSPER